jgi:putative transcriptional regulator
MSEPTNRRPLFQRLRESLEEGLRFAQGQVNLRVTKVPSRPPEMGPAEVVQLRRQFRMSQNAFAQTLNVSTKTVRNWERGARRPSQAALRLLQVFREHPGIVCRIAGAADHDNVLHD